MKRREGVSVSWHYVARVWREENLTHDYVRHGTTNLLAALNVTTGEVLGECKPSRNGADFLAFSKKAVKPYAGKEIHVVLDNLSTHTTPDVKAWPALIQGNESRHWAHSNDCRVALRRILRPTTAHRSPCRSPDTPTRAWANTRKSRAIRSLLSVCQERIG
ncbi:transposase [Streptomyces sp. NPDC048295]|uniref:transposase n=1 Tax=Streptomyces sp. NPDC048295 TaxID=3154617 RepID=UPI0034175B07